MSWLATAVTLSDKHHRYIRTSATVSVPECPVISIQRRRESTTLSRPLPFVMDLDTRNNISWDCRSATC